MLPRFPRAPLPVLSALALAVSFLSESKAQTTNTLLYLNFNDTNATYPAWGSTALTGSPGAGVSTLRPTTANTGLFPTAPTSGYLALAPNASAVTTNTFWGGWAANTTLATLNSPYSAGGLGQTNLAKIGLTARVRARGVPASGAVVILKLQAAGDNANIVPGGYKRVMFEPVFLTNSDWTTVGGTLDNASLTNATAQGTRYNFEGFTNSANFQVLVELSGFNRFGTGGYVAYANNPTTAAAGGRKNPGFDLSASNIRVEVDDVRLFVVDASTNGLISATTPQQLLRNGDFSAGQGNWSFFEGAYYNGSEAWGESNSFNFAMIPGWAGLPYAGFMQNQIAFSATNGGFFTLSFRAKFEPNYSAGQTLVSFMNGNDTRTFKSVDINDQVAAHLGEWAAYTIRYNASASDLTAMNGAMSVKIQPLDRTVGAEESSVLIDNLVLSQQSASVVGPQLTVKVAGVDRADNSTAALFPPLIGYTTPYAVTLQNDGAEALVVSSILLSGTSFVWSGGDSASLQPGESRTFTATATPVSTDPLAGTLTITSNDKDTADQTFTVALSATPVRASDDFNSGVSPQSLGWTPFFNTLTSLADYSSVTGSGGALRIEVDSQNGVGTYPWYFGVKKVFASPGSLDLANSILGVSLRASGVYAGLTSNKVQVYLESLNSAGLPTGRVSLGQWVDETTAGADPGAANYFTADGTPDRVAVVLPEGGAYTAVQSALSSAISQGFDPDAPAFQLAILITDFDFDLDADNVVEVDGVNLGLVAKPFAMSNGSFESDSADFGAGLAPTTWRQFPLEGVSKNLVANGDPTYNAGTGAADSAFPFTAYAGSKALKIYGQNYYAGGVWVGPTQTGIVYQEWPVAGTVGLGIGQSIHARAAARVFAIDPLTGGSTFRFGFRYLDANNEPAGAPEVVAITTANQNLDRWVALAASGTVPAGTAKVQLVAEFVQNNSSDTGSVYLDDVSVGAGALPATQTVNGQTYRLVWSDEFDGSVLNTANWTAETGTGVNGWGNNEIQFYTDRTENLRVENGRLVIQAIKENYGGATWTSARIKTQNKRSFKYGKIEFRAKLPTGVGPWPAAWMLGTNISTVGWPNCGEIDVLEWRGHPAADASTVGHALHSPARHGGNPVEGRSPVTNPATEFHTYAVAWNSTNMTFSVDGVDTVTLTPPAADANAFREEFFLLLNLAMGGAYLQGVVDPALTSATYEVDYVRVYQAESAPADTTPPVLTVSGGSANVAWGASYSDPGASAFDVGDNAAVAVTTNNPINTSVPGIYLIHYTATDSRGNTATTNRPVTVSMANGGSDRGADGLSDLSRYAFGGTGPAALPPALRPVNAATNLGGTNHLVLTYFARTNANVATLPVVSTNLTSTNWSTNGITVTDLQTVATNGTVLHKRQAITPMTGGQKFLRLRSVLSP